MKTEPPPLESELVELEIIAEFNAYEAASDEVLENFEKGLERKLAFWS